MCDRAGAKSQDIADEAFFSRRPRNDSTSRIRTSWHSGVLILT